MDDAEHRRLLQLLPELGLSTSGADTSATAGLAACRAQLSAALRQGDIPHGHHGLQRHLWYTAVEQAFVDSPKYSGLRTAQNIHGHRRAASAVPPPPSRL